MEIVSVREARQNIGRLLDAVITGEEVVIMRRGRPVARLTKFDGESVARLRFPDRQALRDRLPPAVEPSSDLIRSMRNERY